VRGLRLQQKYPPYAHGGSNTAAAACTSWPHAYIALKTKRGPNSSLLLYATEHATSCAHRSASFSVLCQCGATAPETTFSQHTHPPGRDGVRWVQARRSVRYLGLLTHLVPSVGAPWISTMSDTRPSHSYTVPHGRSVPSHGAGKTRSFEGV
jgi:hypothetical protein